MNFRFAGCFFVACSLFSGVSAAAEPDPKALHTEAQEYFSANCSSCHGVRGDGAGPAAKMLAVRPPNFRSAKWRKAITDEQIEKIIVVGGQKAGKSPLMPPFPALAERPELVKELRAVIRELAKTSKKSSH